MPRIGENVRPELGRVNYGAYLAGAQQGAAALGHGLQKAGDAAGDYFKAQGEDKKKAAGFVKQMEMGAKFYGEDSKLGQIMGEAASFVKDENNSLRDRMGAVEQAGPMVGMLMQKSERDVETAFKKRAENLRMTEVRQRMGLAEQANTRADQHTKINQKNADTNRAKQLSVDANERGSLAAAQFLAQYDTTGEASGTNFEAFAPENPDAIPAYKGMVAQGISERQEEANKIQTKVIAESQTLDPAEKSRRMAAGKNAAEWEANGRQTAKTNMILLDKVIDEMESPDSKLDTGPITSVWGGRFKPETKNMQQAIQQVVGGTLRATLGAQFTEKEGERIFAQSFDPTLQEEFNIKKAKRLREDLKGRIADAERQAAEVRGGYGQSNAGSPTPPAPAHEQLSPLDLIKALQAESAQKKSKPESIIEEPATGGNGPPGARNDTPDAPTGGSLVSLVKSFEGWNPNSYSDYGQQSIGYGTKAKAGESSITQEEGDRRLASELSKHRERVDNLNDKHGYGWSDDQKDALTSFDYNTGRLGQLTANGKRSNEEIAEKIPQYRKAGGKVLRGLERRRKAEQELFINGYAS